MQQWTRTVSSNQFQTLLPSTWHVTLSPNVSRWIRVRGQLLQNWPDIRLLPLVQRSFVALLQKYVPSFQLSLMLCCNFHTPALCCVVSYVLLFFQQSLPSGMQTA
eukprot:NODE_13647_length_431_cov_0.812500_g13624_i0.p2 GENE.NODE_13647_length_431_cov_0.812500_g13624_i0~~NODE_13647_length_431_cov_0.812500_g13624_i0.p2  ORF type:complete len:105 (+),score=5.91 NODE_13647_length_431_cov_0.812500_g13624_i0:57-371(+)